MIAVEQIKAAILELPRTDQDMLAHWLTGQLDDEWDRQMSQDAAAGRLQFLVDEAETQAAEHRLVKFP